MLIPKFFAYGACIALLAAEFVVTVSQIFFLKDILAIKELFNEIWKYFIASLLMLLVIRFIGLLLNVNWYTTLIQVAIGTAVYLSVVKLMKCSTVNLIYEKLNNLYNSKRLEFGRES